MNYALPSFFDYTLFWWLIVLNINEYNCLVDCGLDVIHYFATTHMYSYNTYFRIFFHYLIQKQFEK
jgi:hypothetical protein